MTDTITWHWSFPGGIWGLLAAIVLSLAFIWRAYARTLRLLSPGRRWTLTVLRSLLLILLIVCLASPQKVLTRSFKRDLHKPAAIIVDTSGSMVRPDPRGQTRLGLARQALAGIWNPSGQMKLFTFDEKLEPVSSPNALNAISDPQRETHLLASLRDVLNVAPQGGWGEVVVLTDGNDSTSDDVEETGRLFRESRTPLLLAATLTDLRQPDFIRLANVNLPPVNIVNTQYPLDVFVRSATTTPQEITVRVLQNNQPVDETSLTVSPGPHTQKATFHFTQQTLGPQDYQVQLIEEGKTDPSDTLYASTQICNRPEIAVLYYAGSLSIEYRYVRAAFADHPSITIESAVHVSPSALRHQLLFGDQSHGNFEADSFPKTVQELNQYRVIVLADLLPSQLDEQQTDALLDYVKGGGGLIFMVSNTVVASDFSGSKLEQLLPVVFEPKPEEPEAADNNSSQPDAETLLQQQMAETHDPDADDNSDGDNTGADHSTVTNLTKMSFTADGLAVLGKLGDLPEESAPMFREYATVQRAKPGAIVAAEHPVDSNSWGKRPLLAMQHFGLGRSAVLATDSIWRWQLSLPSTSHAYEKLWQQMLFWVANQDGNAPEIHLPDPSAKLGEKVEITVTAPKQTPLDAANRMTLMAYSPDDSSQMIPLKPGATPGTYQALVTAAPAPWMRFEASIADLNRSTAVLNIRSVQTSIEDEHLAPDLSLLHRLAAAAGGQVLDAGSLRHLPTLDVETENAVAENKVIDLWNNSIVFILILALFCAELLLRRKLKLL
jgi:uncharacterized membrane protein